MNKIKKVVVFLLALSGCNPPPVVEGEVISSREIGPGITEHLVQTYHPHIPYYILRTNKNPLQKGAKVVLEMQASSMAHLTN